MAGSGFNPMQASQASSGIGGILGGLFNDSGAPYEDAMDQYEKYGKKAEGVQQPYLDAGKQGTMDFQSWLKGMQDPSGFMNHLMSGYSESPWAKFQQQQSNRAGTNFASANGLSGSSPMAQQLQQNASNISGQDMNNWLQNVLGINTQYGAGQQSLMTGGQNSANALTNMYSNMGDKMGDAAYGKKAGENQDFSNLIGGGAQLGMMAFGL